MDTSHLSKAHDHARAAAVATRQSATPEITVAITEHTHAAGEFANAAQSTSSLEALRTLRLLEQHHKRLAEILKFPCDPVPSSQGSDDDVSEKEISEKSSPTLKREGSGDVATSRTGSKPTLGQQRREMSSSIASNLASARGIRSKHRGQPLSPSVSKDQAPGNLDAQSRREASKAKMQNIIEHQSSKPTWVPPTSTPGAASAQSSQTTVRRSESNNATPDDVGYGRFYSTFGSIINKISAPLAFAGLPLIQEESATSEAEVSAAPTTPKQAARPKPVHASPADAELSKIYSKATMSALAREGHAAATSDSFYVVPTSGHTISYANILSYAEKEKRRLEASSHSGLGEAAADDGHDDFVDARETLANLSPGAKRRIGRARSEKELNNTIEELYTENKSLKDMLDKLTKRLHVFEASSQTSAMALAESYRIRRPGSPLGPESGSGSAGPSGNTKELEEQLAATMKQMEKMERDNRKMQKTLEKYREKWEMLKAGAKARREAQGGTDSIEDASAAV